LINLNKQYGETENKKKKKQKREENEEEESKERYKLINNKEEIEKIYTKQVEQSKRLNN
jgi:hypothetical protein